MSRPRADRAQHLHAVAIGHDAQALHLRSVAQDSGVPVLRNIKLARQLNQDTKIGDPVPGELFEILAIVILWAQEVREEINRLKTPGAKARARKNKPPGEDLTRSVLTQIIVDQEQHEGQSLLPIGFLRQLIGFYGDNLGPLVPNYLEHTIQTFAKNQEELRQQINNSYKRTA